MQNPFENEERRAFRNSLKNFVNNEIKPYVNQWDEEGDIPWEIHQKAGSLGVFGFGIESSVGRGFDVLLSDEVPLRLGSLILVLP